MNFFKELQGAVNSIPQMGRSQAKNNDLIVGLIRSCTYSDDVKFSIEKSVRQVLNVYPQYMVDKIEFAERNTQKRYIELKGQITVEGKGSFTLFIMYPVSFPKDPPFLRILNPNPQQYSVNNSYKKYQSKTDARSYLLNECLQEVKGWKQNSSVASIIIEVNDVVCTNFPFQLIHQFANQTQVWGQQPQQQSNYNAQNQNNSKWGNPMAKQQQPPIPFKPNGSSLQSMAKGQKLVAAQKQKLSQISKQHQNLLPTLQMLEANKLSQYSECNILSGESQKMNNFMNNSQEHEISNFANFVTPADETSEKILNYVASIKAREDTIHMLESKFNEEELSLEQFLKNIRKIEGDRFTERFFLQETLQNYSSLHGTQ